MTDHTELIAEVREYLVAIQNSPGLGKTGHHERWIQEAIERIDPLTAPVDSENRVNRDDYLFDAPGELTGRRIFTDAPAAEPGGPTPFNGKWVCSKCAREVAQGRDDGQIPEHHRACPKRSAEPREENGGPGWYEVIHPYRATTEIALVRPSGEFFSPDGELDRELFVLAASRDRAHRLVRADDTHPSPIDREALSVALNHAGWTCSGGAHEPGEYARCGDCRQACRVTANRIVEHLERSER